MILRFLSKFEEMRTFGLWTDIPKTFTNVHDLSLKFIKVWNFKNKVNKHNFLF